MPNQGKLSILIFVTVVSAFFAIAVIINDELNSLSRNEINAKIVLRRTGMLQVFNKSICAQKVNEMRGMFERYIVSVTQCAHRDGFGLIGGKVFQDDIREVCFPFVHTQNLKRS